MSQEQIQVEQKTQQLLAGPLKHIRAAALAAALVPLASVVATPVAAQDACSSGGFCGVVWNDTNHDGIRDFSEPVIVGAVVTIDGMTTDGTPIHQSVATDSTGTYLFVDPQYGGLLPPGTFTVSVQVPPGTQTTVTDAGGNDLLDSDGTPSGDGVNSVATVTYDIGAPHLDFGFVQSAPQAPGTGTPGYWKNHPDAWPVAGVTVGGRYYTKAEAIAWLDMVGKDKTTTMFSSLVSAMLNVMLGNNASCVSSTIGLADEWMAKYGPVGRGVAASSLAWKIGEPYHRLMDNYNNGMLCAPHRN